MATAKNRRRTEKSRAGGDRRYHLGGVSFNKVFAKLGSDYKKPDATTVISRENFRELLWPLPVDRMIFVGDSSKAALEKLRVRTIGDLARLDREL